MKSKFKITSWLLTFTVVILSSACMQTQSEEVHITLNNDLSGKLVLVFKNVSSDEATVAGQQQEMSDFYSEMPKTIQELKESGLRDPNVELTNNTPLRCDGTVTGNFDNIATILPIFADDKSDFEASRTGDTVSLRFQVSGALTDFPSILSIKISGEVLESNATSYDSSTQTLQWNVSESGNRRIYVRLKMNPSE